MRAVMDEASENFMEVDDLFNGIPQTINSSGGGSILRNDQMHEWRNGDLTQWFDGAIDVIGSHEAVGTRLNDGPLQTYNPWSVIEEPIVLTRGNPYHIDYNDSYGADKLPLNAAEMLQIPVTSGQDAAYVDSWSSTDSGSPMLPSNLAVEFLQDDMINGGADPMELAIKGLSGSVRSTSLQVDGMEFDDEGQKGVATHAAYKMLGSSTYPQSMVEFSMHYAGMLQPPFRLGAGHPQNMVEIPMQSGGMVPPPFRLGAGRVARKKMTHAWWQRGKSTFVIPDNIKMREDRDIMMTIEPGPRDTLQPMQRVVPPGGSRWAEQLLNLCAGAIADRNVARTQHLMWVLNELASFTGDGNERLAAYGLKALFCRITQGTSEATYLRPFHHQEKQLGPKAVHKALVTFHEFNPWHQISYTVTNEALMDVFAGKNHLHIVDIGVMKGLQWPTLIDALANRPGGPPTKLRITTLRHHNKWAPFTHNDQVDAESADFMRRLVTFAKVLGFNCELNLYAGPMECFREKDLKLEEGETLAVCCQFRLHRLTNLVSPQARHSSSDPQRTPRDDFLDFVHSLKPSLFIVSENDVDMLSEHFPTRFKEIIRFWWYFFESTDLSFKGREPDARGIVEYEGSMIMQNAIACEGRERMERNDRQENWMKLIRRAGFVPVPISEDIKKVVKNQLQRNDVTENWSVSYSILGNTNCVNLMWKENTTLFTSLWKTPTCSRKSCKCSMLHD
ncbi:hypothetical protein KC19_2G101500 [Ceratodon purpureus]|uniref:Uncharacterized protein n=1 Tax=Ceratodon purpureus TaxID=3225 RepID=A0A8T0IW45_CERPU|nr:hypothetical protein KC19_2G101500 [Ceratodon purpureus]